MTDELPCVPSPGEQAAAFIADQLGNQAGQGLLGQRIVLLGGLLRRPGPHDPSLNGRGGWHEQVRLCALLLRCGGQLVVLDCPRSRLLIETLLPLAADGLGRWQGDCFLASDLPSACRDAAALLLLPGWRLPPSMPWRTLTRRMRPQAMLFDLRPEACLQGPASLGLRVWRLGGSTRWG